MIPIHDSRTNKFGGVASNEEFGDGSSPFGYSKNAVTKSRILAMTAEITYRQCSTPSVVLYSGLTVQMRRNRPFEPIM